MSNLRCERLHIVIYNVLASCIGQRECEMLPDPSWKWVSMECQWLSAFHYRWLQHDVAMIVYLWACDCFGMPKGSWIVSNSCVNNMGCYCPGWCGGNIPNRSAPQGCHILLYENYWSSATYITDDARPKSVDALLKLIFQLGQRSFLWLFFAIKAANTLYMMILDPSHPQITQDTRATIVETPLTLICRMWYGV